VSTDPEPSPAHGLGQHIVGQRVVVRRVLRGETGPSGGPALTDVLGTCTTWGDGWCVVAVDSGPAAGTSVRIPIADIVSGKPVPPRPSPRLRVSPRDAQLRAVALFPDLETRPVGEWLLRHSATATARRANSVLAMGPSGVDGDFDEVVAFYRDLGQRPIAAVLPDSAEDARFRARGWVLESHDADTVFELASVAAARRALAGLAPGGEASLDGDGPVATGRVVVDGAVVASGVAAYDDDWVGFRSIHVDEAHRRRGLGLAVMAALLEWGAEQGATTAYLQVLGDNDPALAFYERLGFAPHHRYRYLAAPVPD
jgi:N-acetylglutamate synthase